MLNFLVEILGIEVFAVNLQKCEILKIMKKYLLLLLSLVALSAAAQVTDTLARFDRAHFEGWSYSRPSVELTQQSIGALKVTLYSPGNGTEYVLDSPYFALGENDSVRVIVTYTPIDVAYSADKLELSLEFYNRNDVLVQAIHLPAEAGVAEMVLTGAVERASIGAANDEVRLRLAAHKADINNNAAVRMALVEGVSTAKKGDVNGDGSVDGNDINTLINILLGKEPLTAYGDRANVNGEGDVDGADINELINIVLGK